MRGELVTVTPMRGAIARRMAESKRQVPHFYVSTEIWVNPLSTLIEQSNASRGTSSITPTAALVRASAETLRQHPAFNAVWTDAGLVEAEDVNVAVAIAVDDGLIAPAVLGADRLGLAETADAVRSLVERARSRKLRPAEVSEATFTLSNLGMFDVTAFTAIVAPPQVAILAAGRIVERIRVAEGEVVRRLVMTVTLSADHRVVDGADAARFLETFKRVVETPEPLQTAYDKEEP